MEGTETEFVFARPWVSFPSSAAERRANLRATRREAPTWRVRLSDVLERTLCLTILFFLGFEKILMLLTGFHFLYLFRSILVSLYHLFACRLFVWIILSDFFPIIKHPSPVKHRLDEIRMLRYQHVVIRNCFKDRTKGRNVGVKRNFVFVSLVHMLQVINVQLIINVSRIFRLCGSFTR